MGDLPVTGQLNAETITLMNTSRCGTKDPIEKLNKTEDGRKEIGRYYIQGTRWNKKVYCLFWSEWLGILSFYLMDRRLQDCFFFGEIAKSEIAKVTLYSPERSNDGFFKRFTSVEEVWNKRKSMLVIYQYSGQCKSILLSDQFFFCCCSKSNSDWGSKEVNPNYKPNQSDAKPKPITNWAPTFFRGFASSLIFTWCSALIDTLHYFPLIWLTVVDQSKALINQEWPRIF